MLVDFKVKNFLSFEKDEDFSLIAGKGRSFNERLYNQQNLKLLKFAAIFGSNGSGKSNFVRAIDFSRNYIVRGNSRATIQKYYKLNPICKEEKSCFEYVIRLNGQTFTYGFEMILSSNEICSEWLISNKRKDEIIYRHERKDNKFILGKLFKNTELRTRLTLYAETLDSDNSILFLKFVSKNNNLFSEFGEAIILKDVFDWFLYKLKVKFPDRMISDYAYFMSDSNMERILSFFKDFDLSISNYKFIQCLKEQIASKLPKELFDRLMSDIEKDLYSGNEIENNRVMFGLEDDFYIAKVLDEEICFETLQFFHENTQVPFSMNEESDGTKKVFKLLEILFQEDDEVVYIVDEIDRCLHPLLTYNFVNAFLEKAKTVNCQLVVTTHESILLDFKLLRKDEVRLMSKDNGNSKLDSFANYSVRADKVLVKEYLYGKKGVPLIKNNAYKS